MRIASLVPPFLCRRCRRSDEYRRAMGCNGSSVHLGLVALWEKLSLWPQLKSRSFFFGDHTQGTTDFYDSVTIRFCWGTLKTLLESTEYIWVLYFWLFLVVLDMSIHISSLLGGDAWGAEKSQMLSDCNRLQWWLVIQQLQFSIGLVV